MAPAALFSSHASPVLRTVSFAPFSCVHPRLHFGHTDASSVGGAEGEKLMKPDVLIL